VGSRRILGSSHLQLSLMDMVLRPLARPSFTFFVAMWVPMMRRGAAGLAPSVFGDAHMPACHVLSVGRYSSVPYLVVWTLHRRRGVCAYRPHGHSAAGAITIPQLLRSHARSSNSSAGDDAKRPSGFDSDRCVGSSIGLCLCWVALGVHRSRDVGIAVLIVAQSSYPQESAAIDVPVAAGDRPRI